MTTASRVLLIVILGSVLMVIGFVLASPVPWIMAQDVRETFYPETIPWESEAAWKRCTATLLGQLSWPATPAAACVAMHQCAEAQLSSLHRQQLFAAIRATPGCKDP
jgi:hypothetical protein